ncbi:MAG: hypothetical protein A2017_22005 [Lentisphaerae bacterium GWF2_44_16]|nr:MAG: hypothetical protein A2017_22005 [Lentisphaerae bacterium GWF2_44_16]
MKKISLLLASSLICAGILTGCHSGLHTGDSYVRGETQGFNFLGFMTIMPVNYSDALADLYKNADIKDNSKYVLANYYAEPSNMYFLLFSLPKLTVEAEKIDLSKNNVKLLKTKARGFDRGFKFLGFMDFDPVSYSDALSNLYTQEGAAGNRNISITNVTVEDSAMYFILFSLTRVAITADIVEISNKGQTAASTTK